MKRRPKILKTVMDSIENKKAEDIRAYDIAKTSGLWDFMVVCTANSSVHAQAIYDAADEELKKEGFTVYHRDRARNSGWLVLDGGDILLHVFEKEARLYYGVEKLWGGVEIKKGGKSGKADQDED